MAAAISLHTLQLEYPTYQVLFSGSKSRGGSRISDESSGGIRIRTDGSGRINAAAKWWDNGGRSRINTTIDSINTTTNSINTTTNRGRIGGRVTSTLHIDYQ